MRSLIKFLLILLAYVPHLVSGQINITFPASRAVFQRSNGNAAIVYFSGNYYQKLDRIEIRCQAINGGRNIDWTPFVINPNQGFFRGSIVLGGGWYHVDIRGLVNNQVVANSSVEPIGVGEVFVISGQSNAQGYRNYGQPGASDDRVNVIANLSSESFDTPKYPNFTRLNANTDIPPMGKGAWYWGILGDKLAKRLNVPILFINAAYEGLDIKEFSKSIDKNIAGQNPYSGNFVPKGYPYGSISESLNYYTNLLGIRAILWHQGESDNYLSTSFSDYVQNLNTVINATNNSTGKDISWVVARVSKDAKRFYQPVIDAQNYIISNNGNVFAGPNTDLLGNRVDGVHFSVGNFNEVAEQWNLSLNDEFFNFSKPHFGNPPLFFSMNCNPQQNFDKPLQLIAPEGYVSYEWSNGDRSNITNTGVGLTQGAAKDRYGNVYFSAPLAFYENPIPNKPVISAAGPTSFCAGSGVELISNSTNLNYWNTGQEVNKIMVSQSGSFKVTNVNFYGCGIESDPIEVNVLPTPQPTISADGPTEICDDQTLTLNTNWEQNVLWSNGSTSKALTATTSGEYFLKAKNEFGCEGISNTISIKLKPAAVKPLISNLGKAEFCEYESTNLKVENPQNVIWNNGLNANEIIANLNGEYYAINQNEFGCSKKSESVFLRVNPTPERPKVTHQGELIICEGDSLSLISSNAKEYFWSDGNSSQIINPKKTGEYFLLTANEFGCLSPISDTVNVKMLALPQKPVVLQSGAFMLKSYLNIDSTNFKFQWFLNDEIISGDKDILKAKSTGNYAVIASKTYEIENKTYTCTAPISDQFRFFISSTEEGYRFYPNPSPLQELTIETLEDVENAKITIYDFQGRVLQNHFVPIFDSPKKLNLSSVSSGEYIISVKSKQNNFTGKFILN